MHLLSARSDIPVDTDVQRWTTNTHKLWLLNIYGL